MATWEDGPEYAPAERPSAFSAPGLPALPMAPPRVEHAPDAPRQRPDFDQRAQLPPLTDHQPDPGPQRDPAEPYAVASSTMTAVDSAWSTVHHYHVQGDDPAPQWAPPGGAPVAPPGGAPVGPPDPRLPIHPLGTSGPGAPAPRADRSGPEWLPPEPVPAGAPRVRPGAVFNAISVPTFVTLLIGGLAIAVPHFGFLSPLMFILAFVTSSRIAYRRHWVRNTFLIGSGALGTTLVAGFLLAGTDLLALADLVYAVSTAICWLVLAALCLIVWQALAAGERPTQPARSAGWG